VLLELFCTPVEGEPDYYRMEESEHDGSYGVRLWTIRMPKRLELSLVAPGSMTFKHSSTGFRITRLARHGQRIDRPQLRRQPLKQFRRSRIRARTPQRRSAAYGRISSSAATRFIDCVTPSSTAPSSTPARIGGDQEAKAAGPLVVSYVQGRTANPIEDRFDYAFISNEIGVTECRTIIRERG
jgi:hypothetical protein